MKTLRTLAFLFILMIFVGIAILAHFGFNEFQKPGVEPIVIGPRDFNKFDILIWLTAALTGLVAACWLFIPPKEFVGTSIFLGSMFLPIHILIIVFLRSLLFLQVSTIVIVLFAGVWFGWRYKVFENPEPEN